MNFSIPLTTQNTHTPREAIMIERELGNWKDFLSKSCFRGPNARRGTVPPIG
ncbi:protein YpfM [Salmonella enterica subsp. enterica]|nr:protein YpfM [Salmonella enterica subsp. enterica]